MIKIKNTIQKLQILHEKSNLKDIIITSPENIEYFLGVPTSENFVALLHSHENKITLYTSIMDYYRYSTYLKNLGINVCAVSKYLHPEDANVIKGTFRDILSEISKKVQNVGWDASYSSPLSSSVQETLNNKPMDISQEISNIRMIKERWEIEAIRKAIDITEKAIKSVVDSIQEGVTETQLTGIFEYTVREKGISRYAFDPMILFNPENSYPHSFPGESKLKNPSLILVDVGVKYYGRCSDLTRMIIYGKPKEEWRKYIDIINEAIDEVTDKAEPGMTGSEISNIAERVLEKYNCRDRFIHGLGHGIGVVVHEAPYLSPGVETKIEPGTVFTIEPGVYFPKRFGIRIEENAIMTKKGIKVLSKLDRVFTL